MPSETTKLDSASSEREKQKQLDFEIREMISNLTNRLASLRHVHKGGASSHHDEEEDEEERGGVRIITLAGNNVGATMRSEMDEKPPRSAAGEMEEDEALSTYVNSNFQAINNSIMLGGSYSTNDPGVHMDISDYIEKPPRHEKKGKKKKRASSRSDQQSEYSE